MGAECLSNERWCRARPRPMLRSVVVKCTGVSEEGVEERWRTTEMMVGRMKRKQDELEALGDLGGVDEMEERAERWELEGRQVRAQGRGEYGRWT